VEPSDLEPDLTLPAAAARLEQLRVRSALASPGEDGALDRDEALELLALGEVVARKAGYGRQLDVRAARQAGASWAQIGAALGVSRQAAWEAFTRWIAAQAALNEADALHGLTEQDLAEARAVAANPSD
jgi:hypothetical protein